MVVTSRPEWTNTIMARVIHCSGVVFEQILNCCWNVWAPQPSAQAGWELMDWWDDCDVMSVSLSVLLRPRMGS